MRLVNKLLLIFLLSVFVMTAGPMQNASAQSANDGFDPNPNAEIYSLGVQSDGKILVGGGYTSIAGTMRNNIARLKHDGSLDTAFNPNAGGVVWAVALQSDGKILVGGAFSTISGVTRNRVARLNSNGTLDTFAPSVTGGIVYALAVQPDGKIIVGGSFTNISGVSRNSIGRLNADGTLDSGFDPNANGEVRAIVVQPDGKILIGGFFTTLQPNGAVSTTNRNRIARLNADGSLDTSFDPNSDHQVWSLALQPDGKILVGGFFSTIGGGSSSCIARLNSNGGLDAGFTSNANSVIDTIMVQPDGQIVIGGAFSEVNGNSITKVARLNKDGSLDTAYNSNVIDSTVQAMVLQSDGKIVIGGFFTTVGGVARNYLARLYPSGRLDKTITVSLDSSAQTIAVQPDGKFIIGGLFSNISSTVKYSRSIARVNEDGVIESSFNPKPDSTVYTSAIFPDGKIMIGGAFNNISGVSGHRAIARLHSTGSLDTSFSDPSFTSGSIVLSLAVQPDGKIIASGILPGNRVYRFTSDGGYEWFATANNPINSVVVQSDGKILVGGNFTTVNGDISYKYLIRLNSDGTIDTSFAPVLNNYVTAIIVQPDGKILIGGWFTTIGGVTYRNIARLNSDGTIDTAFHPWLNNYVYSMALQSDGKIVVGGAFTSVGYGTSSTGAVTRNRIARLHGSDGTLDEDFNPDADATVQSIAIQPDGKVLIAGSFTTVGGTAQRYFARLTNTGAALQEMEATADLLENVTIQWTREGTGPELTNVWFEKSTDGTTWTSLGAGTRVTEGWQITGVTVPARTNIYIRARGYARSAYYSSTSSLIETVKLFYFSAYDLTVSTTGTGTGTVTTVPVGINCGSDCTASFVPDTFVTLSAAVSGADTRFVGWSGGGCSDIGDCAITMDAAKNVTAEFEKVITIKSGDVVTSVTSVPLTLSHSGATKMRFMFNGTAWTAWEVYKTSKTVTLPTGDGVKTVYVQFDNDAAIYSDTIILDTKPPVGTIIINSGYYATISLDVGVTIVAADDSDITDMCVSTTTACTAWEAFNAFKTITLAGTAGVYNTTKTVYAKFRDRAGKISAQVSDTIVYVSAIGGYSGSSITIDGGASFATKTAVLLTLTRPDETYTSMKFSNDGTTWTAYGPFSATKSYTLPAGDGPRTVYVMFKTSAGVEAGPFAAEIILDTKPPVGAMIINNGAISTNNATVTLQLEAFDVPNVVDRMQFSTDGITWSGMEAYATTKSFTLSAGDGTKKVSVRFIDAAGNASLVISDTILFDTTPPVGTVKINGGATSTTNPLVKLTLAAPTAVTMRISVDNGATWGSWEPFATAKEVTIPGTTTVKVQFRDYTGNVSETTASITLTATPGASDGTIIIKGGAAYTTSTAVTVDIVTGSYTHMQFSTNNTTWSAWEGINPTKTITLPAGDGIKYVLAKFKDSGNEYGPFNDTIILDTKAPTGAIVINGNAAFTNISTVTVSINATDANGVNGMMFSTDGITWPEKWDAYETTKTLTLPGADGVKKVSVKFKDTAGKISAVIYDSITLDRAAPVGKVVINGGAANTSSDIVTLTLTATGATMMQISLDGGSTWGSWEPFVTSKKVTLTGGVGDNNVQVKFKDAAGNVSAPAGDTINRLP